VTLRRTLWGKVLATYREVAATALTVKQAKTFVDTMDEIKKVSPSSVKEAGWNTMQPYEQTLKPLANALDVVKQLKAAGAGVAGAHESSNLLEKSCEQLLQWSADDLCPNFKALMDELGVWAFNVFPQDVLCLDCKAAADACPNHMPKLPEGIDNCFMLCCPSAVK